ncbi:hypothetical protein [Ectopseudomonas oleovorans]|jgi:hypothetical protein|uniref:hypothetical protein n=1 Tax=Ectopseudomonas oleovorans TaxID=301 RepID=UPI0011B1C68A|nr:hypothetical protein [Pseudomonas indoloxydans]
MLPGVPQKKAEFKSLTGRRPLEVCLHGSILYVLYCLNTNRALGPSSFLKKIDLNSFDGDFLKHPSTYEREVTIPGSRMINLIDDALVICGALPEILSLDGATIIYTEAEGELNANWDPDSWLHYWDGRVYRGYGYHVPEQGVDVIDIHTKCIIHHLDLDIRYESPWQGELMCGERVNGNFAVYSLRERRYLVDLSLQHYRGVNPQKRIVAKVSEGRAYVLAGATLLVIDIASGQLLREISYLQLAEMQAHMQVERLSMARACASNMSICGTSVILTLFSVGGYALYLDLAQEQPRVWLWSGGRDVVALNCPGDLVYGLSSAVPMAWDKYSGEVVWQMKGPTATNKIQVGDQWLVFSQLAGYIQCHHWKKPYISPHRPL